MKIKIILLIILFNHQSFCLKLDRVILSSDTNENYIQFWPLVANAWQDLIGIRPTLALIADDTFEIDESLGDVIRFKPLLNIPTSLQAQVVRLLLPAYFPEDVCIISDIDMIPLSKNYFHNSIADIAEDCFVIYRDKAYKNDQRYPMCYNAAKGKIFAEIFDIQSHDDISNIIRSWHSLNLGWHTDEIILTKLVNKWAQQTNRCIKLGHDTQKRIDRASWNYNTASLKKGYYIDSHLPRPYNKHKKKIDAIIKEMKNEEGIK